MSWSWRSCRVGGSVCAPLLPGREPSSCRGSSEQEAEATGHRRGLEKALGHVCVCDRGSTSSGVGLDTPGKVHGALRGQAPALPAPRAGDQGKRLASGSCPLVLGQAPLRAHVALPSWQHAGTPARSSPGPERAGHQGSRQLGEVSPGLAGRNVRHGYASAPGEGTAPLG